MAKAQKAAPAATEETTNTAAAADAKPAKAPKEAKPKVVRETQNGQTKPAEGTKTRALWDIIDEISRDAQRPATRKEVLERAEKEGFNLAMSASLYAHWRKFHGLTGRAAPGKAADTATEGTDGATPPAPPAPPAPAEETGE